MNYFSPINGIMTTSILVGLYMVCMRMINVCCYFSKLEWEKASMG